MDFQTMIQTTISNAVEVERRKKIDEMDILTVGELVAKLEPIVAKQPEIIKKYDHEASVKFDFEYIKPTYYDSWRGVYAELALGFSIEGDDVSVTKFLEMTKAVIGKEFTGYKGGEFVMSKNTPIWVANYGNSGQTGLVDVIDEEYSVILVTKYFQD